MQARKCGSQMFLIAMSLFLSSFVALTLDLFFISLLLSLVHVLKVLLASDFCNRLD